MVSVLRRIACGAAGACFLVPATAGAQGAVLGVFSWQAVPYCNQLTVQVTVNGPTFEMSGTDDRCGAVDPTPLTGTAVMANGQVTVAFSSVTPNGLPRHIIATLAAPGYSGPWTDNAGHSGLLVLGPSNGVGVPVPDARLTSAAIAAGAIGAAQIASGAIGAPALAPGAVGAAALADGAVGAAAIAMGAVGPAALAAGAVGPNALAAGAVGAATADLTQLQARVAACGAGTYLQSVNQDGSVVCGVPSGAGDVSGVSAGVGLTGGGASGDVSLSIATLGVTSALLADGAVTASKLGLPLTVATSSGSSLLSLTNAGAAPAVSAIGSGTGTALIAEASGAGEVARFTATSLSNADEVLNIVHAGTGTALAISTTNAANAQPGISVNRGTSSGAGISLVQNNSARGLDIAQAGSGIGVLSASTGGTGLWGLTANISSAGVLGDNTFGEAVVGRTSGGNGVGAVVGRSDGAGYGVRGFNTSSGIGVFGQAGISGGTGRAARFENVNASNSSTIVEIAGNGTGDLLSAAQSADVRFRVHNNGNVTADGSFTGGGADVAEFIEVSEALEPGDVVEIDPRVEGRFRRSSRRSAAAVAGVVTTRPGVLMNASEGRTTLDDGPALALAGRVPVKVTREGGPIRPGDLLVASATPGHARRAPARPGPGTVIGKALGRLDAPRGVVEMLVMLR